MSLHRRKSCLTSREINSESEPDTYASSVVVSRNHIYFYSDVNSSTVLQLNKAINDLNEPGSGYPEIWIHINSLGGSLYDALAAVDTIRDSPTPIITIVEGVAASAGSLISVAGDKRYIRPNSSVLIHQLSNTFSGKKDDMEDDLENMKAMEEKMLDIYINNTKLRRSELKKIFKNELEYGAQKSLEMGIVDEIYTGSGSLGKRKR